MKSFVILVLNILLCSFSLKAQELMPLYQGTVPNSKVVLNNDQPYTGNPGLIRKVYQPGLEIYLPEKEVASGTAVIICPGGGYSVIVFEGEGRSTAKQFAKNGIAAFVLMYRLPDDSLQIDKSIAPLQDAQQAIKVVRENAAVYGIDPHRIGIAGFSAGGHLASTAATHYKKALIENSNNISLRPDFQILVYPVISMQDELTHTGSRNQLLGNQPSTEMIELYSNEFQVDEETPPAYITHAGDDTVVDVDNSIAYFETLRHHKVPVELHIYQKGNHGFIFKHAGWIDPLLAWMKESQWIK